MDKKFLHRVLDQIVSETTIDYDEGRMYTPFLSLSPFLVFSLHFPLLLPNPVPPFSKHCKNIYGLNEDEINYVWDKYREIIKDKING
jgi:hypothetical protein